MEYTMFRVIVCGLAKLTRKGGENINENVLKNLWYGSGSVQNGLHHWLLWTKVRQIHQGSLTSRYQVWKHGSWR